MLGRTEEIFLSKHHHRIMDNVQSISITSFNCRGFKFRNFNFLKKLFAECSILLLQEHWLYSFEFKEFSKLFGDCGFHAESSMRDDEMLRGRCYGGTAVIWDKSLGISVIPINTSSPRLCAVKCEMGNREMIIMSVYMPVNTRENENEFENVLHEITSICNENGSADLILGGDFNCDFIRDDLRGNMLHLWMNELEVKCPALVSGIRKPTFYGPDGVSSVLDYVFLNDRIFNDIISWEVYDGGDNLSDHSPKSVALACDIRGLMGVHERSEANVPLPQWNRASPENKRDYEETLDALLAQLDLPLDAIVCNNFLNCQGHYMDFLGFLSGIINACERASEICIPVGRPTRERVANVPGWNEFVRGKRETSMFWHEIWKESGRPREGWLALIRRRTRSQYHLAIKNVKRNKDLIEKRKVAETLANSNKNKFWSVMNSLKKSKRPNSSVIDGLTGLDACNAFKRKYQDLYTRDDLVELNGIKQHINDSITRCSSNRCTHQLHSVNVEQVRRAITHLKSGQSEINSNIVSDCFLSGTYRLHVMLAFLFSIMIRHGFTCDVLNVVPIIPIPKDMRKSLNNSDNYRAIAPNSSLAKILDYIIIQQFPEILNTEVQQFAYKAGFSTTLCTFMVLETLQYYKNNNSDVYVSLLDCSKAFDMVNYRKMFSCLIERNMCPLVLRLLLNIYTSSEYFVKWNNLQSDGFSITNGVKQGGVISPLLFTVYTDSLIRNIKDSKLGCHVGEKCAAVFVYADDIILLAPTRFAMQSLLVMCENFADEHNLRFNPSKCKLMIFSRDPTPMVNITLNGVPLQTSQTEKYLGHTLSTTGELIDFSTIIRDMKVRANCIAREFRHLCFPSKAKLFQSMCTSFYGCQLMNIFSRQFQELDKCWRMSVRFVLGLTPRTHNDLLPGLMDTLSAAHQVQSRMCCFFKDGFYHDCEYISFFFKNCISSMTSYMSRNFTVLSRLYDITLGDLDILSRRSLKRRVREMHEDHNWKIPLLKELLYCRDGFLENSLSSEELVTLIDFVCTA